MRVKLVYTAPVGVWDSLGEDAVAGPKVLTALADISVPENSTLEYLYTDIPNQAEFRGGYLRLGLDGKRLCVRIEIDSPRKLTKSELAELRDALDGQVSDGIGESAFDYLEEDAGVCVQTFPDDGGKKSTLVQTSGEAWQPGKRSAEEAANRKRGKAVAVAMKAVEDADQKRAKKKSGKPDPKKLFRLIQKEDRDGVASEIAKLGGDLSFIESGQLPYDLFHDRPLLKLLLDAGLNPDIRDCEGNSLLCLTVGKETCMKLLLDRGADVNFRNSDDEGETALMVAAQFGWIECVRVLLERGADPFLRSGNFTALDVARKGYDYGGGLKETIRLLTNVMKKKK